MAEASRDPAIERYDGPPPDSLADAISVIERIERGWRSFEVQGDPTGAAFAIVDAVSGEPVGMCGIDNWSKNDVVQFGYWLAAGARGRGLATRAVMLMTGWLFEIGAARVFLSIQSENAASAAVARRAGFTYEGTLRAYGVWQGQRQDVARTRNVRVVSDLQAAIEHLWASREGLDSSDPAVMGPVNEAIDKLDSGAARAAEVIDGAVVVHEWTKQAVLLYLAASPMVTTNVGPFEFADRVPLKRDLQARGVRALPGAIVRRGAFVDRNVVLMPSFVNIGARVGSGTMIDTWATVGSCAQVGRNVHLSGGVGLGGVLEPPQAAPVIIEDEAFIGSRSVITEGARVGIGAMLGAGVILNPSIPVIDAETGDEVSRGVVPPWCLAINATRSRTFAGGTFGLPCVLIIKRFEEGERHDKAELNDLLRAHGAAL